MSEFLSLHGLTSGLGEKVRQGEGEKGKNDYVLR